MYYDIIIRYTRDFGVRKGRILFESHDFSRSCTRVVGKYLHVSIVVSCFFFRHYSYCRYFHEDVRLLLYQPLKTFVPHSIAHNITVIHASGYFNIFFFANVRDLIYCETTTTSRKPLAGDKKSLDPGQKKLL